MLDNLVFLQFTNIWVREDTDEFISLQKALGQKKTQRDKSWIWIYFLSATYFQLKSFNNMEFCNQ